MSLASIICRYCGQELSLHTESEPFLIQVPCHRCRYITVVEKSVIGSSPEQLYRRFLPDQKPPDFEPTQDSRAIVGYLITIAGALLDAVIERVQLDLPVARSSLVSVFSRREKLMQERISRIYQFDPSIEPRMFPKIAVLLWGVLGHTGGLSPDVIRNFSSRGVGRFLGWFEPIAEEIVTIAAIATNIRRGEVQPCFDGVEFTFAKTARHTAMIESIVNNKQQQRDNAQVTRLDEAFSREALESQRLVLGFNAYDITTLALNGFEQLKAHTDVVMERNVYWIRVPRLDEGIRRLILSCTLTLSRICEFRSPLFFDFGIRANPPINARDAILNATGINWSVYYPFCSTSETDGETNYVATSRGIVSLFLTSLETQKNALTEQLIAVGRRSDNPVLAREVALLVERGSRALETAVCEMARSTGWLVTQTAPSLPCGDIDTLLVREVGEDEVFIVLCEIKDADLHAHREDAYESQARTVSKALKQLDRKATWVAKNWSHGFGASLFPGVGNHRGGTILKVLITRNYCPLELISGSECVPVPCLKRFFTDLRTGLPSWFEGVRRDSILRFHRD